MFFLVSGAGASGKSTLVRGLPGRVPNLISHDLDEKKVPNEYTRCQHLEEWVQLALQHQEAGQDFLLATHSPLGELLACPSAPKLTGIVASLLNCSDTTRVARMRQRGFDPRWPPTQHHVNWAGWHRVHAWDPQWEQHVIVGNGPPDHNYDRWTSWQQTDTRWQVTQLDTTDITIEQMLDKVAGWVTANRVNIPALSITAKWWK